MALERKGLSKKTRFEVFKRDSFTCQYCGRAAPEAVLRVDHIHPVSQGGDDDLLNLITACFDCNAGKSDRLLSDDTAINKQRAQLAELNERREQLEMLLEWREGMKDLGDQALEAFERAWNEMTGGHWYVNDQGRNAARKLIRKHGLKKCLDAIDTAHNYIELDTESKPTAESVGKAFSKLGGIIAMADRPEEERRMYYVKGILRNRCSYVNHAVAMDAMRTIAALGGNIEYCESYAKECSSWTDWNNQMWDYVADLEKSKE